MTIIFESILPVFLLIVAGFALRRTPVIAETAWPGMEQISYWFLYPSLLFVTIYNADFSGLKLDAMLLALLLSICLMMALTGILWPLLRGGGAIKASEFSSVFQTSIRWNGFIALPIAQKIFAPEGAAVVALAMAGIIVPINVVVIYVVMRFADRDVSIARTILRVALNPLVIAVSAALLFRLLPFGLYQPLNETLKLVGNAALGLGLIAIGASLRPADLTTLRLAVWVPVIMKLIVFPVLLITIAMMLGVSGNQLAYLALCAAVPTAMNGYMLARQLGGDAQLYATVATLQTVLAFFTIPIVLAMVAQLSSG